jgi:hypothetical protein
VLIVLAVALVETGAAVVCRIVLASSGGFLLWHPDFDAARKNWIAGSVDVDEELGWPPPSMATKLPRDRSGAKFNAEFPAPGHTCASAYGDSFVWGEEIPSADGWIEQLSHRLGCRVANYGVSGYGTDDAYLRFRRTAADEAPLALLNGLGFDILQNGAEVRHSGQYIEYGRLARKR